MEADSLSRKKEEVEKLMKDVENRFEAVLEKKRLEWFRGVCREARETYQFSGLGELVMWMIDHAGDIHLKSGSESESDA